MNSFHITDAATILRNEGEFFLATVFINKPFNRCTVVSVLRAKGLDDLANMIEVRIEMDKVFRESIDGVE